MKKWFKENNLFIIGVGFAGIAVLIAHLEVTGMKEECLKKGGKFGWKDPLNGIAYCKVPENTQK